MTAHTGFDLDEKQVKMGESERNLQKMNHCNKTPRFHTETSSQTY